MDHRMCQRKLITHSPQSFIINIGVQSIPLKLPSMTAGNTKDVSLLQNLIEGFEHGYIIYTFMLTPGY
jgi:hypothetical protein